jgi:hypothetical protein
LDLKKNRAPNNVSTINDKTFKLRAELKELKEAVFVVDATGANAYGDVPVSLSQETGRSSGGMPSTSLPRSRLRNRPPTTAPSVVW